MEASDRPAPPARPTRNLVTRADGKLVNVARKTGQLFVCASGCCCGHTDHGFHEVPEDLYHNEWVGRGLRNKVHLSMGGCLGPCPLANVIMLLFDGRALWFHSFHTEQQVLDLYDYIEAMLAAQGYLAPPPSLVPYHFTAFNWDDTAHVPAPAARTADSVQPAGFLWLTQSDTEALALAKVAARLDPDFPPLRVHNISHLQSDTDVDAFLAAHLPEAEAVVLRLLGGRSSFRHGFDRVVEHANRADTWLVCLPGTDTLDPELTAYSNAGVPVTRETQAYLQLGGLKNYEHALRFLADHLLTTGFGYDAPEPQPRHGIYHPDLPDGTLDAWRRRADPAKPTIGLLFYRSHLLSGNTDFIDAIVRDAEARGANVLPVYAYSLKEFEDGGDGGSSDVGPDGAPLTLTLSQRERGPEPLPLPLGEGRGEGVSHAPPAEGTAAPLPTALTYFSPDTGGIPVDIIICTMSFAMGGVEANDPTGGDWSSAVLQRLDVPVLQAITASVSREQWAASQRGLNPLDTAMNVAIPEFDGRIITVPVSFKEPLRQASDTRPSGGPVVHYAPDAERVTRLVGQALRLAALRHTPPAERRVAFVLTNYSAKASRIANAVGLDSPASLLRVLEAMRDAGYSIGDLPPDGDTLLHHLIDRGSYDLDELTDAQMAGAATTVPPGCYQAWFDRLPAKNQAEMAGRWAPPPGEHYVDVNGRMFLAGIEFGNVFVAIQPPRGYGLDPAAIYHMPDLPPPHPYHALYRWLGEPVTAGGWGADAVVHLGKHGTLEWLPGKALGGSEECYPDLFLGDLPMVYPFIINNPGEGAQAKRRTHAVIIDHMTPPMTTAEGYGEIEELQRLVDEYYQLEQLDPSKLPLLQQQIWALIRQAKLDSDLNALLNFDAEAHTHEWDPQFHEDGVPYTISDLTGRDFAHLVENINGYLCELTSAQIRDGLHVLGQPPQGRQLTDTLLALVRLPNLEVPSLRAAVATTYGLDLTAILDDLGRRCDARCPALEAAADRPLPTHADLLETIDAVGERLVVGLADAGFAVGAVDGVMVEVFGVEGEKGCTLTPALSQREREPDGGPLALSDFNSEKGPVRLPLPLGEGWGEGAAIAPAGLRQVRHTLTFIATQLAPNLQKVDAEITNLLHALGGGFVPPGPSGAPTRGMAHVLPTGRNFYTVDPRALPSAAAWEVGKGLADGLLAKHLADAGTYPESVGISIWGTSAMRTHGDDVAEVLALLGVRPRWAAESGRVVGVEVIPLAELGRPRIDVVSRISGFFRDAFPHLIALIDDAFHAVAALDEPPEQNYVRAHYLAEQQRLVAAGVAAGDAAVVAGYRVFGSKPGAYGAGILPLIDEHNWRDTADFAAAYVNWGGYAYTAVTYGVDARDAFRTVLSGVQVAVKNQDNREHDIFDSDDYLQYHGGMIATIRSLTGKNPRRYFGDNADPARPKVRDLKEEALRVFRSRVVNPKWIASVQRHGYKGALELAATVDYLFGYDATAAIMEDWMYAQVAETYALDAAMQEFLQRSNPWALKDIAARLLEAADRGMWHEPGDLREALTQAYLDAESALEGRTTPSPAQAAR